MKNTGPAPRAASPNNNTYKMELTGKVIAALQPREGVSRQGNPWKAQEFVIETQDQYPRKMCFEIFGAERIEQNIGMLQVGNVVKVSFDIDAREWNGRWFNSIRAYRVDLVNDAQQYGGGTFDAPAAPEAPFPPAQDTASDSGSNEDLPF